MCTPGHGAHLLGHSTGKWPNSPHAHQQKVQAVPCRSKKLLPNSQNPTCRSLQTSMEMSS